MEKSEKRLRFEKVASTRVQKIIDMLGLLGNCANKSNYEYTEADVERMYGEIMKAFKDSRAAYSKELTRTAKTNFSFGD